MSYNAGDIVIVPFPFLEKEAHKYRPAIVFGRAETPVAPIYWLAMITGQLDHPWPDDIRLPPSAKNGLQKASLLRIAKVTAVPEDIIVQKLGVLEAGYMRQIRQKISRILGA
jgi:mRNA interferase MazF